MKGPYDPLRGTDEGRWLVEGVKDGKPAEERSSGYKSFFLKESFQIRAVTSKGAKSSEELFLLLIKQNKPDMSTGRGLISI